MFNYNVRPQISREDVLRQVKSVQTAIHKQHTRWIKQGGSPASADVAESIRGWIGSLEKLSAFTDTNSVGFQKAYNSMQEAWDNRDKRHVAIQHVGKALEALKSIPAEMKTSKVTAVDRAKSIKSLYGEENARHMIDPNIFGELQEIRRHIAGYQAAKSIKRFNPMDVERLRAKLLEVSSRYEQGMDLHDLSVQASNSLNAAMKADVELISSRYVEKALASVDALLEASDRHFSPEGYAQNLSGSNAASVKSLVGELHNLINGYHFEMPDQFLPKAIRRTKSVVKSLEAFDDYRARRIAANLLETLEIANESTGNKAVKSGGLSSWKYEAIAAPFNGALTLVDALDKHVSDNI